MTLTRRAIARSVTGLIAVALMTGAISGTAYAGTPSISSDPQSGKDQTQSDARLAAAPPVSGGTSNYIVTLKGGASLVNTQSAGKIVRMFPASHFGERWYP